MHTRSLLPLVVLLAACGPEPRSAPPAPPLTTDSLHAAEPAPEWPGYYEDMLSCDDPSGMVTQLWVRSDSTFILRQRSTDQAERAIGSIGRWHVVMPDAPGASPLLTIGRDGGKTGFYTRTAEGLRMVDEMGRASSSNAPCALERLADEINDEVPRMRLKGTFTYMADALSFQPCGIRYAWPCAGGMDSGGEEEGEVLNSMDTAELQAAYRKAVGQGGEPWMIEVECSLGMGPAMEGDGADEYVFIHKVLKEGVACP